MTANDLHLVEALRLSGSKTEEGSISLGGNLTAIKKALQTAIDLCQVETRLTSTPIRTVHACACSGGTLIAKCIASMPNVLLMNEVYPRPKEYPKSRPAPFTPTDMLSLMRQADPGISSESLTHVFLESLRALHQDQAYIGRSLVLRDHPHSQFFVGDVDADGGDNPSLRKLLEEQFSTHSIMTIRDPIDSFSSLTTHGWHTQFSPSTFDEYCRRYLLFLKEHEGVPIFKYEDFVANPSKEMRAMCNSLSLEFFDQFESVYDSFKFSGDSGRRGSIIKARPQREIDDELKTSAQSSKHYNDLIERIGYPSMTHRG